MGENAIIRIYLVHIEDSFGIVKNFAGFLETKSSCQTIYIVQTFDAW